MREKQRLSDFILDEMEAILMAWEDFARTIEPPALTMNDEELRDHAHQMLEVFAHDLNTPQTEAQRIIKSKGLAIPHIADTAAEIHAEARLLSGYTVVQLVSEYRALRCSVLRLWSQHADGRELETDLDDITRFNEAVDQALAESVARYERLVKESENMFLAILGHDLRNPLGTLVMGSSLLMHAKDLPPEYNVTGKRMFNSAKRMDALISDLIDFTRSHLGPDIPMRPQHGNLVNVCQAVVSEARTSHPDARVELQAPARLTAHFDEARIAQMLSNLIGNALQHGSDDAPITVDVSSTPADISIAVINRGPTIPDEKVASIFDPFVRLTCAQDPPKNERTSLGMGLFIAREIAKGHGGHIDVSSNFVDGTKFTVVIPLG
jgi:signal transduction histidine kinase